MMDRWMQRLNLNRLGRIGCGPIAPSLMRQAAGLMSHSPRL